MSEPSPAVSASLAALEAEPQWLTDVLRDAGHPDAAVASIEVEPLAFTGATTDMARLRIAYEDAGEPGPATLVAKMRGITEVQLQMDQAMGLFEREGRFYAELAPGAPVRTPKCYSPGEGMDKPILLEDLAGLRTGDQIEGLTLADAEAALDALALLHARYWRSPEADAEWLATPGDGLTAQLITQLVSSGAPALERFADQVPDGVIEDVVDAAPNWHLLLKKGTEGPNTVAAGDCRLDNMFFADDGVPVFIDWQLVARTRGLHDIGNLLAGSMDSELLAAEWEPLLRRYHSALEAAGVEGYGWDECLEHYRQNIVYSVGQGMALLGPMGAGDDRGVGDVSVVRALRHVADLDSFAVL
jgi:hypothetical protein